MLTCIRLRFCFKPYYKWNTFNTKIGYEYLEAQYSFKPYYKWNTFNTYDEKDLQEVLDLLGF